MKRFAFLFVVFILSSFITVFNLNYGDAGAPDEVAIQGSTGIFTSADLHPNLNGLASVSYISLVESTSVSNIEKRDSISLKSNTYVLPDYSYLYETTINNEVTHDGNSVWVNVRLANIRSASSTESDIIDQALRGTCFTRISYTEDWSLIRLENGDQGYILSSLISTTEVEADEIVIEEEEIIESSEITTVSTTNEVIETTIETLSETTPVSIETSETVLISESELNAIKYASCDLNVRSGPGIEYDLVNVLSYGQEVSIIAVTDNGWYRLSDGNYIKVDYCSEEQPVVITPSYEVTENNSQDDSSYSDFATYTLQFVGTPYVYAGSSPSGFDCSGFVLYVYANYYGICLPHNAAEIATMGSSVSADGVQCGDVLCHDYNGDGYIDHVSIYIGNSTCIHASDSRHGVITTSYPMGSVVTIRRFI